MTKYIIDYALCDCFGKIVPGSYRTKTLETLSDCEKWNAMMEKAWRGYYKKITIRQA